MQLENLEQQYSFVIHNVTKNENTIVTTENTDKYIHSLLNSDIVINVLDKNYLMNALNRVNFKSFCDTIIKLEKKHEGVLSYIMLFVVEKIKEHDLQNSLNTNSNHDKNEKKIILNQYDFFFARIKLLVDVGLIEFMLGTQMALAIIKMIPLSLITNKIALIKQYCSLSLHNTPEIEQSSNSIVINIDNNTELQIYLNKYLAQLKKVKKDILVQMTNEIIAVLIKLPIEKFIDSFSFIDYNYPGLSVHFIMEGRCNKTKESCIFINHMIDLETSSQLDKVFQPNRIRLVRELLKTNDKYDHRDPKQYNYEFSMETENDFIMLLKNSWLLDN